mmetsp:Transcript_131107/g.298474  ORF Transcript_131107/g.298474 Transcript_131107/m.298474 type:complete len:1533 (+) Transcript_131107:58-4656(+)
MQSAETVPPGWLRKRGSWGGWKKKWFQIEEFYLVYYKEPTSAEAGGWVLLPGSKVVPFNSPEASRDAAGWATSFPFGFEIQPSDQSANFPVYAASSLEMTQWITALRLVARYPGVGYLHKQGGSLQGWKRRWFVIEGQELAYYVNPDDMVSKANRQGAIPLHNSRVLDCKTVNATRDGQQLATKQRFTFEIQPEAGDRVFYLHADSEDEFELWISEIAIASGSHSQHQQQDTEPPRQSLMDLADAIGSVDDLAAPEEEDSQGSGSEEWGGDTFEKPPGAPPRHHSVVAVQARATTIPAARQSVLASPDNTAGRTRQTVRIDDGTGAITTASNLADVEERSSSTRVSVAPRASRVPQRVSIAVPPRRVSEAPRASRAPARASIASSMGVAEALRGRETRISTAWSASGMVDQIYTKYETGDSDSEDSQASKEDELSRRPSLAPSMSPMPSAGEDSPEPLILGVIGEDLGLMDPEEVHKEKANFPEVQRKYPARRIHVPLEHCSDHTISEASKSTLNASGLLGHAAPRRCVASGPGLAGGLCGQQLTFVVQTVDEAGTPLRVGGHRCTANVASTSAASKHIREQRPVVNDNEDGTFSISYMCTMPGMYEVFVTVEGGDIAGSPFLCEIQPGPAYAPKSECVGPGATAASMSAEFRIVARDEFGNHCQRGGDRFGVRGSGSAHVVEVADEGDGTYTVVYTLIESLEPPRLEVFLNGTHIKNSPLLPAPPAASRFEVSGVGSATQLGNSHSWVESTAQRSRIQELREALLTQSGDVAATELAMQAECLTLLDQSTGLDQDTAYLNAIQQRVSRLRDDLERSGSSTPLRRTMLEPAQDPPSTPDSAAATFRQRFRELQERQRRLLSGQTAQRSDSGASTKAAKTTADSIRARAQQLETYKTQVREKYAALTEGQGSSTGASTAAIPTATVSLGGRLRGAASSQARNRSASPSAAAAVASRAIRDGAGPGILGTYTGWGTAARSQELLAPGQRRLLTLNAPYDTTQEIAPAEGPDWQQQHVANETWPCTGGRGADVPVGFAAGHHHLLRGSSPNRASPRQHPIGNRHAALPEQRVWAGINDDVGQSTAPTAGGQERPVSAQRAAAPLTTATVAAPAGSAKPAGELSGRRPTGNSGSRSQSAESENSTAEPPPLQPRFASRVDALAAFGNQRSTSPMRSLQEARDKRKLSAAVASPPLLPRSRETSIASDLARAEDSVSRGAPDSFFEAFQKGSFLPAPSSPVRRPEKTPKALPPPQAAAASPPRLPRPSVQEPRQGVSQGDVGGSTQSDRRTVVPTSVSQVARTAAAKTRPSQAVLDPPSQSSTARALNELECAIDGAASTANITFQKQICREPGNAASSTSWTPAPMGDSAPRRAVSPVRLRQQRSPEGRSSQSPSRVLQSTAASRSRTPPATSPRVPAGPPPTPAQLAQLLRGLFDFFASGRLPNGIAALSLSDFVRFCHAGRLHASHHDIKVVWQSVLSMHRLPARTSTTTFDHWVDLVIGVARTKYPEANSDVVAVGDIVRHHLMPMWIFIQQS